MPERQTTSSALVRAPLILETGIRSSVSLPLDLDAVEDQIVESFTDLLPGHRSLTRMRAGLDLVDDQGTRLGISATIQHISEFRLQVASRLGISAPGVAADFSWTQSPPREADDSWIFEYDVAAQGAEWRSVPIRFRGFLPDHSALPEGDIRDSLELFSKRITAAYPQVRYFAPFREQPTRRFLPANTPPPRVGSRGENAGKMIVADYFRRSGNRLLGAINEVLGDHLPGWTIDLEENGGMYSIVLRSAYDRAVSVNLADGGTGVAQVLPILVQRGLDLISSPRQPVLEITEQPELHLHPAAHGALADMYLAAISNQHVRFLIETHSETFLLRLRRRIAEGTANPDDVAVYFVEQNQGQATARRVGIDERGALDYWPEGVFSEDYEESKKIALAQLDREE